MRIRLTLLLASFLPALVGAQVTAIKAGAIVDPDAGTTARNQVILVEKGRITAIGDNVAIPAGAKVIDLSSSTVSPGLVDAHPHLCMEVQPQRDANNYYLTTLRDPDSYRTIEGVVNARTMLEAGFTAVRDIGNEGNYDCVQVRRAILKAMTTEAHRLLGLDGQRGFLRVGMAADLIATPANPLEDITTLKAVSFVMKNGAVVRNDAGAGKP